MKSQDILRIINNVASLIGQSSVDAIDKDYDPVHGSEYFPFVVSMLRELAFKIQAMEVIMSSLVDCATLNEESITRLEDKANELDKSVAALWAVK